MFLVFLHPLFLIEKSLLLSRRGGHCKNATGTLANICFTPRRVSMLEAFSPYAGILAGRQGAVLGSGGGARAAESHPGKRSFHQSYQDSGF